MKSDDSQTEEQKQFRFISVNLNTLKMFRDKTFIALSMTFSTFNWGRDLDNGTVDVCKQIHSS